MAGILAAIRLREAGCDDVVSSIEKADRLGGTWRENSYPGLSCDVPSHLYSYSFAPNPEWTHRFSPGPEILAYFQNVARRWKIDALIRYRREVDDESDRQRDPHAGAESGAAGLRDDPQLVAPFIEEALRLESPFRYHLRHATRTTEVYGVQIAAGSTVLLFWGAANRDPAEYERPDEVVFDRPVPRHHLAFGRGIHFCLGAPLGRLEAEIVLTQLLARTEHFTLDPDRPPARVNSLMVRRFDTLPLVVQASRMAPK